MRSYDRYEDSDLSSRRRVPTAERHARRALTSRSQPYAEALSEYLARQAPDEVTEAMNHVIDHLNEPTDPFVTAAAQRILEQRDW